MICHRQRIVFVHLRRTAGNSIEAALGGILLFDRWFRPTDAWDNRLHRGRSWYKRDRRGHRIHATAAEIRARYPHEFDRYFTFTIVRNPWTQMASLYGRLHAHDRSFAGFRDWLRRFALPQGTVPQASLCDDAGRCLVDFVGRFERLQEDHKLAAVGARRGNGFHHGAALESVEIGGRAGEGVVDPQHVKTVAIGAGVVLDLDDAALPEVARRDGNAAGLEAADVFDGVDRGALPLRRRNKGLAFQ